MRALKVGNATHSEVESLLRGYLEYTLERELKSVAFLQRLRREMTSTNLIRDASPQGIIMDFQQVIMRLNQFWADQAACSGSPTTSRWALAP